MATRMPDPPSVSTIQHYLFESPWLGAVVLLAAGLVILWLGLRDGRRNPVITGLIGGALAVAWVGIAVTVKTPAEHSEAGLKEFMGYLEAGDASSAQAMIDTQATLQVGGATAPRLDVNVIRDRLDWVMSRYPIESVMITDLDSYTVNDTEGRADFAAFVRSDYPGKVTASFTFRRDPQGMWEIVHIVLVSVNDKPPPWQGRGF